MQNRGSKTRFACAPTLSMAISDFKNLDQEILLSESLHNFVGFKWESYPQIRQAIFVECS